MRKITVAAMALMASVFAGAALANGGHGGGGHGGGGHGGGHGGFHGGGFHGGVGFYFGGPYLGWPYPLPYDYYYPYGDYPYADGYDMAPSDAGPGPAVPQQQSWYYCDAPQGYYPYVRACTHPWQAVAPTPPPPPQN